MSKYLTEAGWKAILNKPKNLGLRVQGTGVSDRLRKYETANKEYATNKTATKVDAVLKLVTDLKNHAQTQSTAHRAFTEATDYLKEVVKAAGKREEELGTDKERITLLEDAKKDLAEAQRVLTGIQTAADFQKKGGGTLNGCVVKLMKAGKFKEVSGDTMAKLNNRCMAEPEKVTDGNLTAKKSEVKGFLDKLKTELDAVKI